MYFPIGWAGVEFARESLEEGAVTVRRQLIPLATVALVGVLWAYPAWQMWSDGRPLVMWKHPVIEFRHFVTAIRRHPRWRPRLASASVARL